MDATPKPERVTLSRNLSEFLVELSIALQKHAMYPGGHPSLGAATAGLTYRAARLLEDRPTLVFGVARRQLIIDGVATDPDQPVLRRLAEGLHRHHLGAVSLSRGLQPDELSLALRALSAEVEQDGPLGLAPAGRLEWPHVRLHPLTFDRLELIGATSNDRGSDGKAKLLAGELWLGLARAAMATDQHSEAAETVSTEPSTVAKAIDEHDEAEAYDQVIVGYLLQIANELKSSTGAEAAALRRRTARLIAALKPETLKRLVAMGGDVAQRREFVLNAASGMAVDSVVEILKAAAEANGQAISHGLVRMLSKLAEHAELGPEQVRPLADGALRDQVQSLLSGWDLADPNPEAYGKVLQHLATAVPARRRSRAHQPGEQDPLRIVQMSLEIGEYGPLIDRAMDQVINEGRFGAVLQLLSSPPATCGPTAGKLMAKLASPPSLAMLAEQDPFDSDALERLFPAVSLEGYKVLLDSLVTSRSRSTRRKLLDRLGHTDLDVGPLITAYLENEHWYVIRNMLMLLRSLNVPPGFSLVPWAQHPDARVRHEAIQLQLMLPAERGVALRMALEDRDLRIVRIGLAAIQQECPRPLVAIVADLALNGKLIEELRVLATRALGRSRDPRARDALLDLVDGGRTLLGRPKLAAPTPICVAALRALAEGWPRDPAATPMIAVALASSDPELRQAALVGVS
jgi:hypothetical protein